MDTINLLKCINKASQQSPGVENSSYKQLLDRDNDLRGEPTQTSELF